MKGTFNFLFILVNKFLFTVCYRDEVGGDVKIGDNLELSYYANTNNETWQIS